MQMPYPVFVCGMGSGPSAGKMGLVRRAGLSLPIKISNLDIQI